MPRFGPYRASRTPSCNLFPRYSAGSSRRSRLAERDLFLESLRRLASISENRMAQDANLYLTSKQLRELASFDFEIGNHTYTHSYCRSFSQQDFDTEVDRNKTELESASGTKVRSFSLPYGSSEDLTPELAEHLERTGYKAAFFSESVANPRRADLFHLDRISTCARERRCFVFRDRSPASPTRSTEPDFP